MANKKYLSERNFWSEGGGCIKEIYWSAAAVRQMCRVRGWYNNPDCERDFNAMLNGLVYEHRHNPSREIYYVVAANIYAHTDPYPAIAAIRKELLKTFGVVKDPEKRKKSELQRSYYERNREEICRKAAEYRKNNPEKYAEYHKKYRKENVERLREYQRDWCRKRRMNNEQSDSDRSADCRSGA
ncbi:MAG: hypothetical protein K6G90_01280 [Clostridia bacterium]|nr:hypothetical protein [Clostridia bacterium]